MTQQVPDGVMITTRDIYDKLIAVEHSVAAMTPQAQTVADHETRLRAVEKWKWSVPPTAIAALIALVEQLLARKS